LDFGFEYRKKRSGKKVRALRVAYPKDKWGFLYYIFCSFILYFHKTRDERCSSPARGARLAYKRSLTPRCSLSYNQERIRGFAPYSAKAVKVHLLTKVQRSLGI